MGVCDLAWLARCVPRHTNAPVHCNDLYLAKFRSYLSSNKPELVIVVLAQVYTAGTIARELSWLHKLPPGTNLI
jgi:hypothetical protein